MAGATPAITALTRAGIDFTLHPYEHDPRAASFGLEAAAALGAEASEVFKTLVVALEGGPGGLAVAVVPVSGSLDLKAVARVLGASRARLAPQAEAERATGYVVGGISPVGQRRRLATVLDETARGLDRLYVSAGRRGLDLALAPADLVRATAAVVARIARAEP